LFFLLFFRQCSVRLWLLLLLKFSFSLFFFYSAFTLFSLAWSRPCTYSDTLTKRFELSYAMDIALWKCYVLLLFAFVLLQGTQSRGETNKTEEPTFAFIFSDVAPPLQKNYNNNNNNSGESFPDWGEAGAQWTLVKRVQSRDVSEEVLERSQEVGKEGDKKPHLSLQCHHQNESCIKMDSKERDISVTLIVRDKVTKTVSTDHNFWKERIAETESNRGLSAY